MSDGYFTTPIRINGRQWTPGYPNMTDLTATPVFARFRAGTNNPHWRLQVKRGESAGTNLTGWMQDATIFNGKHTVTVEFRDPYPSGKLKQATPTFEGIPTDFVGPLPFSDFGGSHENDANAKAIQSLYRKLKKVRSQFWGGVFLFEFHKTVDLIVKPASGLRRSIKVYLKNAKRIIRNQKRYGNAHLSKSLAEAYLEAVFGWQPLLADIADATKALQRLGKKKHKLSFRASGNVETFIDSVDFRIPLWSQDLIRTRVRRRSDTVIYYGSFKPSVLKAIGDDRMQRIIDLSGFSWRDFLPTAWEVLPWSFLVDYFTNIGDLLAAVGTDTSTVAWLNKVVIADSYRTDMFNQDPLTLSSRWPLPIYRVVGHSNSTGTLISRYRSMNRTVNIDIPTMSFHTELPDLWSQKYLNMAALMLAVSRRFR